MLGLGISSTADMGWAASTKENVLLSVFQSRISADGGSVEDVPCLSLDLDLLLSESSSFTTGLLEFYPGAAAAYSLRQLRRSVSPYAIRVRRANDLEQDIGFNSNGELDTNALLDFADGGDAWVSVWYDQSSNGNDAVQSTKSSQPKIVDRTTGLVTENGKPAVQFDGTDDSLDAGAVDVPTMAISVVASYNTTDGLKRPFAVRGVVLNDKDTFAQGSDFSLRYDGDFSTGTLTPSTGTQYLRFSQRSTSAQTDFVNSSSNVNDTKTLPNIEGTYTIGQACILVEYFNGKVQEAIAWESDQSANRTGIESNINDFYSIYS